MSFDSPSDTPRRLGGWIPLSMILEIKVALSGAMISVLASKTGISPDKAPEEIRAAATRTMMRNVFMSYPDVIIRGPLVV